MAERISGGVARPIQKARVRKDGWTKQRRQLFLDALAGTCNVRIAVEAAGLNPTSAYALRRRDPVFAALWRDALTIGYERLEEALLAHALEGVNALALRAEGDFQLPELVADPARVPQPGSGASASATRQAVDVELALLLLNRHRANAEGAGTPAGTRRRASSEETDAALRKKLDAMARRLRANQ